MKLLVILLLTFSSVAFSSKSHEEKVKECTQRGVKYFKEIGSFPKLSDGRDAKEVAEERCRRTLTAY